MIAQLGATASDAAAAAGPRRCTSGRRGRRRQRPARSCSAAATSVSTSAAAKSRVESMFVWSVSSSRVQRPWARLHSGVAPAAPGL
jgi:hypothetical protein